MPNPCGRANETRLRQIADLAATRGKGSMFAGRLERRLARAVGLTQFGVNLVVLEPGARTASRHWHDVEDEFVMVLEGAPTLVDENGAHTLEPGAIAGFVAGEPNAHHLINQSGEPVVLLVVGSRRPGEETITYPDDDFGPVRK